MTSDFAKWLNKMQHVADEENVIVQARHIDFLDYEFKMKTTPEQAFKGYKKHLTRWERYSVTSHPKML